MCGLVGAPRRDDGVSGTCADMAGNCNRRPLSLHFGTYMSRLATAHTAWQGMLWGLMVLVLALARGQGT